MAHVSQLPCGEDGVCMRCKATPLEGELLACFTCATSWHVACLTCPPEGLGSMPRWRCPDCTRENNDDEMFPAVGGDHSGGLVAAIKEIESDVTLSEQEKAKKRQELLSGRPLEVDKKGKRKVVDLDDDEDVLEILDESLNCSVCLQLFDRPVTTPCGHNFCVKCFQKWCAKGNQSCANCRQEIPKKMKMEPPLNSALVTVIGMARGRIFVTVPNGHFGPILPEHDLKRNQGVLELQVRIKLVYSPVVLSGGYQGEEDHGEWFLYSGSGGRSLKGNKRTGKKQSVDQKFAQLNQALRVSCIEGYPIRVVRSHKEKRSSYAPNGKGLRYDGIYRIEMCWRKVGAQGFKICRYLFVRCDNSPAPWTSDEHGDRPRPLPVIKELKKAFDIIERKETPSWGFDEADSKWKWLKPPPVGKVKSENSEKRKRRVARQQGSQTIRQRLLKEFRCLICWQVLTMPVTTPCGHNFCKTCLENAFFGKPLIRERSAGGRTLRSRKNVMNCPFCSHDVGDFLSNKQVNRGVMDLIEHLKKKTEMKEGASAKQVSENEEAKNDEEVSENKEGENDEEASDQEVSEYEEGENDEEASDNEEVEDERDSFEESENEEGDDIEKASSASSDSGKEN